MFFNTWADILRAVVVGGLAYISLIAFLRISGKRTLSKLNAFDLVVTVALGSTLATVLLNKDVSLAEGVTGFVVLIGLQYGVAWFSVRSRAFRRIIRSEPTLLYYQGEYLDRPMREERVTADEIRQVIRFNGYAEKSQVEAVILESDGRFTVLTGNPSQEIDVVLPSGSS